jgi:hypothetical protein
VPWLLGIAANVLADTVRRDRIEARHESGSVYRSTWPARTDIRKPKTGSLHIGLSPGHSSCFPRTSGKRSSYASSTSSRTSKLHPVELDTTGTVGDVKLRFDVYERFRPRGTPVCSTSRTSIRLRRSTGTPRTTAQRRNASSRTG